MRKIIVLVLGIYISIPFFAYPQDKVYEPLRGSDERKTQMDLLRSEFTPKFNGQKLIFELTGDFYKSNGSWALMYVNVYQPGGKPVDFSNSKYKKEYDDEMIDSNGIFALFKRANNKWLLIAHADFPTDVPIGCWWKEFYAPKSIFGSAAQDAKDCD